VTLVSRFHPQANLYELPKTARSSKGGRPRLKGRRVAKPAEAIMHSKPKRFTVNWYGGKTRRVELIWGEGHWYKAADGLVPVRWVFVQDIQGTHRDEYFYSTDPEMPPGQIVSLYTGRWSIEVTFQEARAHLGLATPRNWSKPSVLRTAPCLLGLFSVVSLIFQRHAQGRDVRPASFAWYAKAEPTFSDAMACVRRIYWAEVFQESPHHAGGKKLPRSLRTMLLDHLSRAA
jgi:hypothetical protein